LKAETPEFEEITAFQAGGAQLSVRRQGAEDAAKPLRSEYVTGTYLSTPELQKLLKVCRIRKGHVHFVVV
jgi:hypothetical protein